jgi:hypothetical protein
MSRSFKKCYKHVPKHRIEFATNAMNLSEKQVKEYNWLGNVKGWECFKVMKKQAKKARRSEDRKQEYKHKQAAGHDNKFMKHAQIEHAFKQQF